MNKKRKNIYRKKFLSMNAEFRINESWFVYSGLIIRIMSKVYIIVQNHVTIFENSESLE